MLDIRRVSKTYANRTTALEGVDLSVGEGEILAIVGRSGCGKSTLLRIVSGLDHATAGRVLVAGEEIRAPAPKVGLVFQEPRLLPWLSVAENIAFGIDGWPAAARNARVAELLGEIRLPNYGRRWPKQLSGGQAQRVAIARALAPEPHLLLLDEPFSALDALTRAELQDHILALWQRHRRTFVIVTHDIEEAVALADRVVVMQPHPGRVVDSVAVDAPRPRDRASMAFEHAKRAVRLALDAPSSPARRSL